MVSLTISLSFNGEEKTLVSSDKIKVEEKQLDSPDKIEEEERKLVSPNKIKHFVFSRFFPHQDPNYPHDVCDVDFLKEQVLLVPNILRSLENQTCKNFEVVFLANDNYFSDPKYEFIFTALKNTTLPVKVIKRVDMVPLLKGAYDNYDFVIQSRLDFDDFMCKDAVADIQSKVTECDSILAYGYCKGYEYIYGELHFWYNLLNEIGHLGMLQSLILKSSFAKKIPPIMIGINHSKIKILLKEFLEKNGIEFTEKMFQQNTSKNAFIYFRHEYSYKLNLNKNLSQLKVPNPNYRLTTSYITKEQLKDEFGFFHELKSII